jgi:hypothetical protein
MSDREKKLLIGLGIAVPIVLIARFGFLDEKKTQVVSVKESVPQAEQRLAKLRVAASTVSAKETVLKRVDADLTSRENGISNADTAPQAQARLLEVAKRVAKAEGIDIRGGEFGQPKVYGSDYGEVSAVVLFECRIDQFVNLMAGLSHEPELIAPSDIRINASNPKEKTVLVRMTVGGLVPKKMVPDKKGLGTF